MNKKYNWWSVWQFFVVSFMCLRAAANPAIDTAPSQEVITNWGLADEAHCNHQSKTARERVYCDCVIKNKDFRGVKYFTEWEASHKREVRDCRRAAVASPSTPIQVIDFPKKPKPTPFGEPASPNNRQ